MRRVLGLVLASAMLVLAVLVQLTVLSRLDLPAATPDLVLVVVAAIGCVRGPTAGAVSGFVGGLLLDLAPPADHPAGQWALVLTVVGYIAGRLGLGVGRPDPARLGLVAVLALGGSLAYLGLSALLGAGWPGAERVATGVLASAVYAAVLALVLLPALGWLLGGADGRARW